MSYSPPGMAWPIPPPNFHHIPPPPPPPPPMAFGEPSRKSSTGTQFAQTSHKGQMVSPAFTPVQARRTLAQPPPSSPSSQPQQKGDFAPEIRAYVGRCFEPENAIAGIDGAEIKLRLKDMITEHMNNGTVFSVEWDKIPTIQQFIKEDRERQNFLNTDIRSANVGLTRKRKSDEALDVVNDSNAPWRTGASMSLEDRMTQPSKGQNDRASKKVKKQQEQLRSFNESKYQADLDKRIKRFGIMDNKSPDRKAPKSVHHSYVDDKDLSREGPVVGTNQNIEKRYLRLTAPPKPETVRPLAVLQQTLELLKKKWRKDSDYLYICDQFKSLRQDLTVQHIKTDFTVTVYETHARIALEKGDLGEYNQCQTQLRGLYKLGLTGHPTEFLAYRILYFVYTCNRTDMNNVLADLTEADKDNPVVRHALNVRSASAFGNYHKFFQLYLAAPNMGAYLIDKFIGRERLAALAKICKTYKPDVKIRFLTEELGFESDAECVEFIVSHNAQDLLLGLNEDLKLATGKAGGFFEAAKNEAFKVVDIKGQL